PAVAQGDRHSLLRGALAHDVAVELGDDLARGHVLRIGAAFHNGRTAVLLFAHRLHSQANRSEIKGCSFNTKGTATQSIRGKSGMHADVTTLRWSGASLCRCTGRRLP